MNPSKKTCVIIAALVIAASFNACAVINDTPYKPIIERNVFALKPPPTNAPSEAPAPPSNIKLTGITTILGNKRVLLMVQEPARPGQPPSNPQSYILTEGQREGQVEVIQIDEKAGSVKINNGGLVQTLNFDKDGVKLPSTGAALPVAGSPAALPMPGAAAPNMTAAAAAAVANSAAGNNPGGLRQIPTRAMRLPTAAQPPVSSPGSIATPGATPGVTTGSGQQQNNVPTAPSLTPEEQMIMMEVERERNRGNANYPPLPPTPLSPGDTP